ncbi:hypothetical protein NQZ79_g4216 [Umbelopsis isabellina]|nr:hypothetical protein NQZ79_g4216 [Umbelopsis isabellina]
MKRSSPSSVNSSSTRPESSWNDCPAPAITYHFNPTEKHSLVKRHVSHCIQTAKRQSRESSSSHTLSLTPINTSMNSGGLPSPPVEADHEASHDFSGNKYAHIVSPTATPTEEQQRDARFNDNVVACVLQKLKDERPCSPDEDASNSPTAQNTDQDSNLPDEEDIRQKIADLTAEKHRLFQLMKSKMQGTSETSTSETSEEDQCSSQNLESHNPSATLSDNEKENSSIERTEETMSNTSTKPASSSSSSPRPQAYRSRPLSDRGYHHPYRPSPSSRSTYNGAYRCHRIDYSPRFAPPMRQNPYGAPPPLAYRRRPALDRRPPRY